MRGREREWKGSDGGMGRKKLGKSQRYREGKELKAEVRGKGGERVRVEKNIDKERKE